MAAAVLPSTDPALPAAAPPLAVHAAASEAYRLALHRNRERRADLILAMGGAASLLTRADVLAYFEATEGPARYGW